MLPDAKDYIWWLPDELEHGFQFRHRSKAKLCARLETLRTRIKHHVFLQTVWRIIDGNARPFLAWTVTLQHRWIGDELVTVVEKE